MAFSLRYAVQAAEHEFNRLSIDDAGNVTVQIQQAQVGDRPRALGWYYLALGPDHSVLQRIERTIRRHGLLGPSRAMRPFPGMRSRTITLAAEGRQVTHVLDRFAAVPEEFAELDTLLAELFALAEGAPIRTFSVAIGFAPARVRVGEELRIHLFFRNEGRAPTTFRNPATFAEGGSDTLRINLWKTVREDDGQEGLAFVSALDLAGREFLIEERRSLRSDATYARIPEHGQLEVWTVMKLPSLDREAYRVEVVYYGHPVTIEEQQRNPDLLVGEFHSDLATLTVSP